MNKKLSWVLSGTLIVALCASGCGVGFGGGSTDVVDPFESEHAFSKSGPQDEINIDGFLKKFDEAKELTDDTEDNRLGSCQDIKDLSECNGPCTAQDGKCVRKKDGCSGKLASECNGLTATGGKCVLHADLKLCYEEKPANCAGVPLARCNNGACEVQGGTCTRKADRCQTVADNQCEAYACRSDNRFENGAKCYHDQALWNQNKQEAFAELKREIKNAKAAPGSSAYNEFHAKRAAFALYEIARGQQPQHQTRLDGVGCGQWGDSGRGRYSDPGVPIQATTQKWRQWLANAKLTNEGQTILGDLQVKVTAPHYDEEKVIRWLYEIHSRQRAMAGVALGANGIGRVAMGGEANVESDDKIYAIGLAQKNLRRHFYEQENFIADSSKAGELMKKTAYYFIKWVSGAANPQAYKDPEQFARNNHDDSVFTKVIGTIQDLNANAWTFYDRITGTQRSRETAVLALNLLVDDGLINTRGAIFNADQKFGHESESLQGLLMGIQTKKETGGCNYGQLGLGLIKPLEERTTLVRKLDASKFFDKFRIPAFVKAYVGLNPIEKAGLKASADEVVDNLADPHNTFDPTRYELVGINDVPNQVAYAPYRRLLTLFKQKWMQDYDILLARNPEDAIYSRDAAEHWCNEKIKRLYMLFNYPEVVRDIVKVIKDALNDAGGTADIVDYLGDGSTGFRAAALSDNELKLAILADDVLRDKIPMDER